MKIAVVGCKGLLGNALVRVLGRLGEDVVPLDLPDCDVSTRMFTLNQLSEIRPEVIINATGIMKVDWLEKRPNTARTVHVQGTANLREAARRSNALLVHFSCAEVFGEAARNHFAPLTEKNRPEPVSIYAKTKLDSERAASEYERHLIIRTSTLFGKIGEHTAGNMVESILRALRRSELLRIISDIPTSPTWSDDLARVTHFLVRRKKTGLYHIVNQETATPYEISQEILKQTGLKRDFQPMTSENYGFIAPRAVHTMLDAERYRKLKNAPEMNSWRKSLADYLSSRSAF